MPFSVVIGVSSAVVTKLLARMSPRPLLVGGLVVVAAGLWLLRGLDPGDSYAGELLPILVLTAFSLGLVFVPILLAGGVAPPDALADGFSAAFTVSALIILAAAVLAAAIGPTPKAAGAPVASRAGAA